MPTASGRRSPIEKALDAHIGQRIRTMRLLRGLMLDELARALRLAPRTLADIESGARQIDNLRLVKAAVVLNRPMSYFFSDFSPSGAGDTGVERQTMFKKSALAAAFYVISGSASAAEVDAVAIARLNTFPQLPLIVMEDQHLVEKHAKEAGLASLSVSYRTVGNGAAVNDALLTGAVQIGAAGVTQFLLLWDRTQGEVKAVSAVSTGPNYLLTRNERVKTVADFSESDRINVQAPKSAIQAILLQMAASKAFGFEKFNKLDPLTVAIPPGDAATLLISGRGELTADFISAPFAYREMDAPGVRVVLSSDDVLGGPSTATVLYSTSAFHAKNPQTVKVILAALDEANELIGKDREWAAELFMRVARQGPELVKRMAGDSQIAFGREPHRVMTFADFMHRTGTMKTKPPALKDLFVASEAVALSGD